MAPDAVSPGGRGATPRRPSVQPGSLAAVLTEGAVPPPHARACAHLRLDPKRDDPRDSHEARAVVACGHGIRDESVAGSNPVTPNLRKPCRTPDPGAPARCRTAQLDRPVRRWRSVRTRRRLFAGSRTNARGPRSRAALSCDLPTTVITGHGATARPRAVGHGLRTVSRPRVISLHTPITAETRDPVCWSQP